MFTLAKIFEVREFFRTSQATVADLKIQFDAAAIML